MIVNGVLPCVLQIINLSAYIQGLKVLHEFVINEFVFNQINAKNKNN